MNEPPRDDRVPPRPPPLQFSLRTMLAATAALAMVFAVLRWIGAPPQVGLLVLVLVGVSVIAAVGLVVVIAGAAPPSRQKRPGWPDGPEHNDEPKRDE